MNAPDMARSLPHIVKEVLLSVAGVWAEGSGRELEQAARAGTALRKVKLPHRFHHPHIDRECLLETIREEQDAIGELVSNAWQVDQFAPCFRQTACTEALKVDCSLCNHSS